MVRHFTIHQLLEQSSRLTLRHVKARLIASRSGKDVKGNPVDRIGPAELTAITNFLRWGERSELLAEHKREIAHELSILKDHAKSQATG